MADVSAAVIAPAGAARAIADREVLDCDAFHSMFTGHECVDQRLRIHLDATDVRRWEMRCHDEHVQVEIRPERYVIIGTLT